MKPIRVLELRSVWGTGGGPEKTILLGTARTDPRRFAVTVCYLRDRRDPVFGIDNRAGGLPASPPNSVGMAAPFGPTTPSASPRRM